MRWRGFEQLGQGIGQQFEPVQLGKLRFQRLWERVSERGRVVPAARVRSPLG